MTNVEHNAESGELLRAKAEALRDFATNVCDRNARYGVTREARHFGETYGRLARAEAAVIESVTATRGVFCECETPDLSAAVDLACRRCGKFITTRPTPPARGAE